MSKHFQKLLKALKTSEDVKALGFNKDEIKSLASDLDKNLKIEEEASDEDIESAIDEAVERAIPFLQLAQKQSSRIIKKNLQKKDEDDDLDDDDTQEDDDDNDDAGQKKPKKNRPSKSEPDDEIKTMLKAILKKQEAQDETIAKLQKGNTTDKRRSKLEKLLKDTGSFGKRTLRQFEKMNFESDDDFDEFVDEIKEDLEDLNQERANAGLSKLGAPETPKKEDEGQEVKELTDKELDDLAAML